MTGTKTLGGAVAVLLCIGLSACGADGTDSAGAGGQVPQAPQRMTPIDNPPEAEPEPPDSRTAEQPDATTGNAPDHPAAEPSTSGPQAGTRCERDDLKLSLSYQGSGAGSQYQALVFTNDGDRSCVLHGFPGVSYVAGKDGHQVGEAAFRSGSKGAPVALAPGQQASALLKLANVANFDAASCEPTDARGLRVYPPHSYDSVFVPMTDAKGCAAEDIDGHQITVWTIQRGVPTGP
ncbi:DUF4232 domain-containing protein [Saccharopolyspora halophila]|uniref:DUF4232 domain-containing protein n=1 Tax=Saccharopolyspora halophila TaxID=405551 RepID=A0ABP5T4Q0_9PSEU